MVVALGMERETWRRCGLVIEWISGGDGGGDVKEKQEPRMMFWLPVWAAVDGGTTNWDLGQMRNHEVGGKVSSFLGYTKFESPVGSPVPGVFRKVVEDTSTHVCFGGWSREQVRTLRDTCRMRIEWELGENPKENQHLGDWKGESKLTQSWCGTEIFLCDVIYNPFWEAISIPDKVREQFSDRL